MDDEKDIVKLIQHGLENEGYRVVCAGDAETALRLLRKSPPDLIVLDIMLPKMDGLELLRRIRPETAAPVILLSAKRSEMDRVLGLKLGADDYMVKPFSLAELKARVEARLRRPSDAAKGRKARLGGIEIDFERHEVVVDGTPSRLAPKEFVLLKLLVEADGKVLSRETLLQMIWGHDEALEIDTRTVDQHIARLRRKLRAEASRIVTVPNFGYQIRR